MTDAFSARDFMVTNPLCAYLWQPMSSVRRSMLVNSLLPARGRSDPRNHSSGAFSRTSHWRPTCGLPRDQQTGTGDWRES